MRSHRTETVVIGGGQAGLAVSAHLTGAQRDHVVLERGRVGERWRAHGWDSLRLLTPNWMSRLPGWSYRGDEPDGYMPRAELVDHLQGYADAFGAPVRPHTEVRSVSQDAAGYRVRTDRGDWSTRHVVVASGACAQPFVPAAATPLTAEVVQLSPRGYRNPDRLPPGGVLVVGGSASGVQIADEVRRSGRSVVLSTGRHTRAPRSYRGMDIWWWLEQLGRLDRTIEQMRFPGRARREPSLQLTGRRGEDLDLAVLAERGVVVTGRLVQAEGRHVRFADDLHRTTAAADAGLRRLLDAIDSHVVRHGLAAEVLAPAAYCPVHLATGPRGLDLVGAGIRTVIWATGYRPSYPWLHVPVLDRLGQIRQHRGVTPAPGLYAVGLRFGQRRSSGLLDGVRHDARAVVAHLTGRPTVGDPETGPLRDTGARACGAFRA